MTRQAPPASEREMRLARLLEECLREMGEGKTDLDALAGRHPWAREEIRPLLEVARALQRRSRPQPPSLEAVLRRVSRGGGSRGWRR